MGNRFNARGGLGFVYSGVDVGKIDHEPPDWFIRCSRIQVQVVYPQNLPQGKKTITRASNLSTRGFQSSHKAIIALVHGRHAVILNIIFWMDYDLVQDHSKFSLFSGDGILWGILLSSKCLEDISLDLHLIELRWSEITF